MILSIIICTHNRPHLLADCLESIAGEQVQEKIEVIVIDNGTHESAQNVFYRFEDRIGNLRYYKEAEPGLSIARNTGASKARGEWLAYIDDDATLRPGYIERAIRVIEDYEFDCFGGMYFAKHTMKRPWWMPTSFGTKIPLREEIGPVDSGYLSGGNFLIKKELLDKLGGFNTAYGMKGKSIEYGEENELQNRLRKRGNIIGFDPKLQIDHLVLPAKYKLSWHIKSQYKHAKSHARMQNKGQFFTLSKFLGFSIKGLSKFLQIILGRS